MKFSINFRILGKFLIILLFPIIFMSIILKFSIGNSFINQIISKGTNNLIFIILSLIIFFLAYKKMGWLKYLFISSALAIFYGYLLKWLWTTGYSEGATQIWGYLPTSDGMYILQNTYSFLNGKLLNGATVFRPLFTLYFSSIFWTSNLNLILSFGVMSYLNLISSLISSNEVYKSHGAFAAAIFLTSGLLFYKFFIGTIMTEQLGFLLCNITFALFWNGTQTRNKFVVLVGLFVLSFGLNVRAGAMFALVTLPIWIGYTFEKRKFSVKLAGIAFLISFSGLLLNFLFVNLFVNNDGGLFSNFGYTLYGVAAGNKGWYQFRLDHPEITAAGSIEIAIRQIINNPFLFLKGILLTYKDYFNPSTCWAFCFLQIKSIVSNTFLLLLFISGIISLIKNRRKPLHLFLIFLLFGILLSIPFAPTRDAGNRTYTITNPFLISILIIGFLWIKECFSSLLRNKRNLVISNEIPDNLFANFIILLSYPIIVVVLILTFVVPIFLFISTPLRDEPSNRICGSGEVLFSFITNKNSWLHVIDNKYLQKEISIPYATQEKLISIVENSPYHKSRSFLDIAQNANPGTSIGYAPYYYQEGLHDPTFSGVWAVINSSNLPDNFGQIEFCGKEVTTIVEGWYYIRTFIASN